MATRKKKKDGVLGEFEGRDVLQIAVEVTNAGDGLSKSMAVLPLTLDLGDEGYIVLKYEVAKIRFEEVKDTDALKRVQVLRASAATLVDDEVIPIVEKLIDEQAARVQAAEDAIKGQTTVDSQIETARANAHGDHVLGMHADGLVEGCPDCEEEEALAAEGS